MKKLALSVLTAVAVVCLTASAFAGGLAPGASTSCNDAKSIKLEASGTSSAGDRGNANAVIWKSSNATTVPISLGGGTGNHGIPTGSSGNTKASNFKCKKSDQCVPGAIDNSVVGMSKKDSKGRTSVTLGGQNNFSRGDSIGDISGEVRITNTGTVGLNVTCG